MVRPLVCADACCAQAPTPLTGLAVLYPFGPAVPADNAGHGSVSVASLGGCHGRCACAGG
jgi:hypothetical protein